MNTMYVRVVSLSLILSLSVSQSLRAADEPKKDDHTKTETTSTTEDSKRETKGDELKVYNDTIEALKKSISMKAIGADEKKTEKLFKLSGDTLIVKNKDTGKEESKPVTLAKDIEALKVYREKLKSCEEGSSAKLIAKMLDSYIAAIHASLTAEKTASTPKVEGLGNQQAKIFESIDKDNNHLISEKVVNTYTLQIQKFFELKDAKRDSSEEEKKAKESIEKIADVLWGGKMRKDVFKLETAATDAETKQIYADNKAAIQGLDKSDKVCKDVETAKAEKAKDDSQSKVAKDDKAGPLPAGNEKPVDPTATGGAQAGGTQAGSQGATGSTGTTASPTDFDALLRQAQERAASDNQLAQNQLRDALDAARRATDDAALRAAQQDQLQRSLQDNNQLNNDALGQALRALGQQQAPQNRTNSRGDQVGDTRNPNISPSIQAGQRPQPQIPPVPPMQQPYPPQGMGGMPFGMMQPPPTPPMPSYQEPQRYSDDMARRAPVVVQDPRTSGLLELLKLQQQLLMNSQQQRQQYAGGPNIYGGAAGRLAAFGARATGSRRGGNRVGARMNGTASGGVQGRMGNVATARTTPPR